MPTLFKNIGAIYSNAHSALGTLPFSATPHLIAGIITVRFMSLERRPTAKEIIALL